LAPALAPGGGPVLTAGKTARRRRPLKAPILIAALFVSLLGVTQAFAAGPLMMKDIIGLPGKEVRVLTVDSAPGATSPVHRHNGQVFVYVLSGHMIMQVAGKPPVTVGPGETFYEDPNDIHTMSKNVSTTEPAKFLVFMIMPKGAPVSVPVKLP
jgi:quercetin dioxygenase-like cupin family protein